MLSSNILIRIQLVLMHNTLHLVQVLNHGCPWKLHFFVQYGFLFLSLESCHVLVDSRDTKLCIMTALEKPDQGPISCIKRNRSQGKALQDFAKNRTVIPAFMTN